MKYTISFFCGLLVCLFSCKKEQRADAFAERYPSTFFSKEWHVITPYVRMYTRNGEVRNESIIQRFLQRKELTTRFNYQEVVPEGGKRIFFVSPDSILVRFYDDQVPVLINNYVLSSSGRERYFKSPHIKYSYLLGWDFRNHQLRKDMSLYKWEYDILPEFTNNDDLKTYAYKPEFSAYKKDSNTLVIPYLNFLYNRASFVFANKFNISVLQSLTDADTLLVQEMELYFKRQ